VRLRRGRHLGSLAELAPQGIGHHLRCGSEAWVSQVESRSIGRIASRTSEITTSA
jgi:hypothetical protein